MLNPQNTPQAKPVKIRIMSGGEEHSSLDSLLHHFDIEDVCSLLDGRLSRWLKGQNEQELAEYIESIENKDSYDDNQKLIIIKHFFAHEDLSKYSNLADVAELWSISDAFRYNGKSLYLYVVKTCDAEELLKIYEKKDDLPYINNWLDFFELHKDEHNADAWYWYGVLSNQQSWIEKAKEAGSTLALEYMNNEYESNEVDAIKAQQIVDYFGETLYKCKFIGKKKQYQSHSLTEFAKFKLNAKEEEFVKLLLDIEEALKLKGPQFDVTPWDDIVTIYTVKWHESLTNTNSFLFHEKVFLLVLYDSYIQNHDINHPHISTLGNLKLKSKQVKDSSCFQYMYAENRTNNSLDGILKEFVYFLLLSFRTQNRNDSINNTVSIVRKETAYVFFEKFGESLYEITGEKQEKHSVENFKGFFLYPKEKDLLLFLLDLEAICLMRKANNIWSKILDDYSKKWEDDILTKNHFYIERLIVLSILDTGFFTTTKFALKNQCENKDVSFSFVSKYNLTKKILDWCNLNHYKNEKKGVLLKKFVELLKEDLLE